LLSWMLRRVLGTREMRKRSWASYLGVGAGIRRFRARLRGANRPHLDDALVARFAHYLTTESGPHGGTLREDLVEDQARWARARTRTDEHDRSRRRIIGALRLAMAHVAVERLSPDLVILDEFQRFKDLFPSADEATTSGLTDAQRLAQRLIASEHAKVLVL